jgi:hypothetical protein
LRYESSLDKFVFEAYWADNYIGVTSEAFTENFSLQRQMIFLLFWDGDKDIIGMAIDGQIANIKVLAVTPPATHPDQINYGCGSGGSAPGIYILDEIKTFSEAVLPYGGFFTGNGEVDVNLAHADLIFYWDCEASGANASNIPSDKTISLTGSAAIVSTDPIYGTNHLDTGSTFNDYSSVPVVSGDIINMDSFSISLWVNFQSVSSAPFLGFGEAGNAIKLDLSSAKFRVTANYNSVSHQVTGNHADVVANTWYYVKATLDGSDKIRLFVNEIETGTAVAMTESFAGSTTGTLYIGSDHDQGSNLYCYIDQVFITNNPNTPEIWTAFGKPLHLDLIKKNGVYQQYGS